MAVFYKGNKINEIDYVDVTVVNPNNETITIDILENGTRTITPNEGYDGIESITINTNVECQGGGKFLCPEHISFSGSSNTTEIDLTNLDTSNVTNMSQMFQYCSSLTSLDLTPLDTSNVTNMSYMFIYCSKLTSLDVSNWDTSNVTNMSSMFASCNNLTSLDLSSFDTSNVTKMSEMFRSCSKLTSLNISNFNTSNLTSMSRMFESCYVETLDLSGWDTSNVKIDSNAYSRPFYGFKGKYLILGDKCKFENEKYFNNMFNQCSNLTTLDLSNWNIPNATTMENMFQGCSKLTSLNISNFDTTNVTSVSSMFGSCSNLTEIHWKNFGNGSGYKSVDFSSSSKLGVNTTDYPNARQSLVDTLITHSFDRASAGYATCTVTLSTTTKTLLTQDEIAAISAKGYTIA